MRPSPTAVASAPSTSSSSSTPRRCVAAAEQTGLPVVLQISENAVRYHGALAPIALATQAIAERATVPCVLHLDHAVSEPLVDEAVALGFTSVMFDGVAARRRGQPRARPARSCSAATRPGVSVEAELGEIGGKDGVHAPGVRTDPDDAAAFVGATGVDALAVAVGSSHAMTSRTAELDLRARSRRSARAVPVPLVLHGSSGVAGRRPGRRRPGRDDQGQHRHAPQQGVHHGAAPTTSPTTRTWSTPGRYLGAARDAVAAEAARLLSCSPCAD